MTAERAARRRAARDAVRPARPSPAGPGRAALRADDRYDRRETRRRRLLYALGFAFNAFGVYVDDRAAPGLSAAERRHSRTLAFRANALRRETILSDRAQAETAKRRIGGRS